MKILHIITGLGDGGAEGVLFRLCCFDKENTHSVVSLMGPGKYGPLLKESGVELFCLGMPQGRITFKGIHSLWRVLRAANFDVVQTWLYHADLIGGIMARLAGYRNLYWGIRNTGPSSGALNKNTVLIIRLCSFLSRSIPQKIISCSVTAVQNHINIGYMKDKFVVIPNGYDLDAFSPNTEKSQELNLEFSLPDNTPILGMVARDDPQKDHDNLLAALREATKQGTIFHCLLIGVGMIATNQRLVALIKANGLVGKVSLLGSRDDIPNLMNLLDIHILSSISEGFPNVLAEAMACGTPCVTTNVGDAALIVGGTGWMVPSQNSALLGGAINDAINHWQDKEAWSERQTAARAQVLAHFEVGRMIAAFTAVWQGETDDHPN